MSLNLQNIGGAVFIRKTADQTVNNSVAVVDDNHLYYPIGSYERLCFEVILKVSTTAVADIRVTMTGPAGSTIEWTVGVITATEINWYAGATEWIIGCTADRTNMRGRIYGFVVNGATAGTLKFRWAQMVAEVSDTKVLAESFMRVERM